MKLKLTATAAAIALTFSLSATAAELKTFSAGTAAVAADVNANFSAVNEAAMAAQATADTAAAAASLASTAADKAGVSATMAQTTADDALVLVDEAAVAAAAAQTTADTAAADAATALTQAEYAGEKATLTSYTADSNTQTLVRLEAQAADNFAMLQAFIQIVDQLKYSAEFGLGDPELAKNFHVEDADGLNFGVIGSYDMETKNYVLVEESGIGYLTNLESDRPSGFDVPSGEAGGIAIARITQMKYNQVKSLPRYYTGATCTGDMYVKSDEVLWGYDPLPYDQILADSLVAGADRALFGADMDGNIYTLARDYAAIDSAEPTELSQVISMKGYDDVCVENIDAVTATGSLIQLQVESAPTNMKVWAEDPYGFGQKPTSVVFEAITYPVSIEENEAP